MTELTGRDLYELFEEIHEAVSNREEPYEDDGLAIEWEFQVGQDIYQLKLIQSWSIRYGTSVEFELEHERPDLAGGDEIPMKPICWAGRYMANDSLMPDYHHELRADDALEHLTTIKLGYL